MTASKEYASRAAGALAGLLRPGTDIADVTAIIEKALDGVPVGQGADAETAADERAARLLSASPVVIYSFKATDDFAPTFVSVNLLTLCSASTTTWWAKARSSARSTMASNCCST